MQKVFRPLAIYFQINEVPTVIKIHIKSQKYFKQYYKRTQTKKMALTMLDLREGSQICSNY